jgi:voltage-gated potassium channel
MVLRNPLIRIYLALTSLLLVIVIGTVGYMCIEGFRLLDALYMCVITMASVGFMEVHPLSDVGRGFTMVLILANFAVVGFIVTVVTRYVLDGHFIQSYKIYNMQKRINDLSGHIIICGYGRNGSEAARVIRESGKDCVVIERSLAGKDTDGLPYYLAGDATLDEVLREAGIARATALISTLPTDADNVFIVLTARAINPKINIISRASDDSSVKKLKIAGADNVIMPDKIGGSQMAALITKPDVIEFLDILMTDVGAGFQVVEIPVTKPTTVQALDCWNATGATLLGIKINNLDYLVNPVASTPLTIHDRAIVMGSKAQIDAAKKIV